MTTLSVNEKLLYFFNYTLIIFTTFLKIVLTGKRSRTYNIFGEAKNGGKECASLPMQTETCVLSEDECYEFQQFRAYDFYKDYTGTLTLDKCYKYCHENHGYNIFGNKKI